MHIRPSILLLLLCPTLRAADVANSPITEPPKSLGLDPFYKKCIEVDGLPIVSSEKASDYALKEAAYLVGRMLEGRKDVIEAMVKNKVHAIVDRNGVEHDELFSDLFGKAGMQWLRTIQLPSLDRLMLDNHLEHLESLKRQIHAVDQEILAKASRDEDVRLLLSMTGVDIFTALLIRSEIGNISRFPEYKKLISWAGLAPSLHQSGSIEYHGSITKQGSKMLRWVMVEAARVAVNHDEKMRAFYARVKYRRGDQKAIVATASKMLKIIWFMLARREPYLSRNQRRYEEKLNRIEKTIHDGWLRAGLGTLA